MKTYIDHKYIINISVITSLFLLLIQTIYVNNAFAQGVLTLSVSPTSFEISVKPGQEWKSTIDIINVNNYDLTVYADVVNFIPNKETKRANSLLPVFDDIETNNSSLAEWIHITREPIFIERQTTKKIPFTIKIPEHADPGNNYAAVLIGTKSASAAADKTSFQTSQVVTSLFSVDVAGEVIESIQINEFYTDKKIYLNPNEILFNLGFQNDSNVHMDLTGNIDIYNILGKKRGVIQIDNQLNLKRILPNSTHNVVLSWTEDISFFDIGLFKATIDLKYGKNDNNVISTETYFWILPLKEVLIMTVLIFILLLIVYWLTQVYVRSLLKRAGVKLRKQRNK